METLAVTVWSRFKRPLAITVPLIMWKAEFEVFY